MDYKYLLETILTHIDEGIIFVDSNANITFFNENAAYIAGITSKEATGKNILDIFPDLTPETSTFYRVLKNREAIKDYVQTYENYKGEKVTTLTSTIPLIKNGEIVGALEKYRDLSQVMHLSDKVLSLQKQLFDKNKMNKQYKGNGTTFTFHNIIGESIAIRELKEKASKIANSDSPVLVYGETGTGKELLVQAIHNGGKRRNKPFVAQNCAAIPKNLLEGILFGTSSGSFTGAKDKSGLFELADGGTLFLDEINSMDVELQGKLLRVLQDGVIRRIGDNKTTVVDVRIMTATNEEPIKAVERRALREDLYYRLNVLYFEIPPLRERIDDIQLLVNHFISNYNKKLFKNVREISPEALEVLKDYPWHGNIRQLEYTIESIMNFIETDRITVEELPYELIKNSNTKASFTSIDLEKESSLSVEEVEAPLKEALTSYERLLISKAVEKSFGNCAEASRRLKIPRQTLHNKLQRYNIDWKKYTK